jgi:hypothetical protein
MIRTKIEVGDIDGYSWDWSGKYLDDFTEELIRAYRVAYIAEFPDTPPIELNVKAAAWAKDYGARQIVGIESVTREAVRDIVSRGLATGERMSIIARDIQDDYIFSQRRAITVARTETAKALGEGQLGAAEAQGRDEKHWVTSGDIERDDEWCRRNEQQGWISITDGFDGGVNTVPQHPNCRCVVRYRTKALHVVGMLRDFRCSGCSRLLGRDVHSGTRIHCRHCKEERTA